MVFEYFLKDYVFYLVKIKMPCAHRNNNLKMRPKKLDLLMWMSLAKVYASININNHKNGIFFGTFINI